MPIPRVSTSTSSGPNKSCAAQEAIEESRIRVAKALEAAQEDRERHRHQ